MLDNKRAQADRALQASMPAHLGQVSSSVKSSPTCQSLWAIPRPRAEANSSAVGGHGDKHAAKGDIWH